MLRNYLLVALRSLWRQRRYSLINIAGLSIGIACCALMALYVDHELRFDAFHERGARIYRLVLEDSAPGGKGRGTLLPADLVVAVKETVPGVRRATGFIASSARVRLGDESFRMGAALVSPDFLEIFSFPLHRGDPTAALDAPSKAVISAAAAERIFGLEAPQLDQTAGLDLAVNGRDFTVSGIAAEVPPVSSLDFDILVPLEYRDNYFIDNNDIGETVVFVELAPGADPGQTEAALAGLIAGHLAEGIKGFLGDAYSPERAADFRLVLQPLSAVHLDGDTQSHYLKLGNAKYAWILAVMGLLILLVGCANFASLAIGSSANRAREVGIRKVVGARRGQLAQQFWGETALLCLVACVLGLVLVRLALPAFNELAAQPLAMAQLAGWRGPVLAAAVLALTVLVAGSYPALVLSRLQPARVLKGGGEKSARKPLLRGLLVVQYALAIGLIAGTLTMLQQVWFLRDKGLGFDQESVVVVPVPGEEAAARFRQAALGLGSVAAVGTSDRSFTSGWNTKGLERPDGSMGEVRMIRVDPHYRGTLGLELVAGRDFNQQRLADVEHAVLVNQRLVEREGWADPVGRILPLHVWGDLPQPTIIGVVRDFHIDRLHKEIEPLFLTMNPAYHGLYYAFVRLHPGDVPTALEQLQAAWEGSVSEGKFSYYFLDERLDQQYSAEDRWSRILAYAAGLVVLVSCLGLFGQATLAVARRTKEIGIRKVLGASAASIVGLFGRELALSLAAASLVGWAMAWWAMERWLADFAYRIELGPAPFLVGAAIALGLAMIVVVAQSAGTALRPPVETLRYE
ncbi:MAG: FtsX-like permease family protein [Candidatus Latescibacteria bacterium]|nr:FtsX-like permease family protein [Candidatus Latescibacterota bacterium]